MDNEDGGLNFREDHFNLDTPDDASCDSESLTARLEQLLACLPANSDPAQRLRQLLDDFNRDAQKHKPRDKIQPCVPEETLGEKLLSVMERIGWIKKKEKRKYPAVDYHLQHYDDAYNVDVRKNMTQRQVEKQQAHLAGRKASLQRRYDQRQLPGYDQEDPEDLVVGNLLEGYDRRERELAWRQPESSFRDDIGTVRHNRYNPEELIVGRMLEGYDRREQEMAWRHPDSSFRDEIETAAVLEVELMPFYTDAYSKKLRLSKPEAKVHLVRLTKRMAQLYQVKDFMLNLQKEKELLTAAYLIRLMQLDVLIPESDLNQELSRSGQGPTKLQAFLDKIRLYKENGGHSSVQDYQESLPGFYQDAYESYDGNQLTVKEAKTLAKYYAKRRMELRQLYVNRPEDGSNYDDDDSTYQQLQDALERRKQEMEFRLPYSDFRRRVLRGQPIPGPSGYPPLVDHLDQMRGNLHHKLGEHKDLQTLIDEINQDEVSADEFVPELMIYYEDAYNKDISKTLTTEDARLRRDLLNQQVRTLKSVDERIVALLEGYCKLKTAMRSRIDETKALISSEPKSTEAGRGNPGGREYSDARVSYYDAPPVHPADQDELYNRFGSQWFM